MSSTPPQSQREAQERKSSAVAKKKSTAGSPAVSMVAAIAMASAGLGMLAGVAMANRSSSSSSEGAAQWRPGGGPALRWGGGAPRCEACGGSGKEECRLCARWSDAGRKNGRSGCGACAGTRRTPCRCCGGSGTGRRAPVRIATSARAAPTARTSSR